jgi:hypothetical protein
MWTDFIHRAISNLYPGADQARDYTWLRQSTPEGVLLPPSMAYWNAARLGPLNMAAVQAEAERLSALPTTRSITYKSSLWRRATDAEVTAMVAMLGTQPLRFQRLFTDVTRLEHDSAEFPILKAGLVQLFGTARADVLLAPDAVEPI